MNRLLFLSLMLFTVIYACFEDSECPRHQVCMFKIIGMPGTCETEPARALVESEKCLEVKCEEHHFCDDGKCVSDLSDLQMGPWRCRVRPEIGQEIGRRLVPPGGKCSSNSDCPTDEMCTKARRGKVGDLQCIKLPWCTSPKLPTGVDVW